MPEMVVLTNRATAKPVAVRSRPTLIKKPMERYGVEEQLNIAEEVIASALCAAELE